MFGNFLVFYRKNGRHEFNQQYFGAHGVVEECQFGTDGAGAYHDHGFRFVVERQGLAVSDDAFPVLRDVRKLAGACPCCQHDVLCLVNRFLACRVRHLDFLVCGQFAVSLDHGDVVFLEKVLDTFAHLVGYSPAAGDDCLEIRFGVLDFHPVISGVFGVFQHLCRFKQRFGRDTSPVQADTPEFRTFYYSHVHS